MEKTLVNYLEKTHVDETFVEMLLRLIDEQNLTDSEIYHRAHLDRRFFSKLRSDRFYKPKKKNVIALALALHLDNPTSKKLIKKAGYILTSSSKFDLVIRYCIEHQIYDLIQVNQLLFDAVNDSLFGNE